MIPCPFCDRIRARDFTETPNDEIVTFEPLNPVTPGHRLFVPTFHVARFQYGKDLLAAAMREAAYWLGTSDDANLIVSSGPNATQTVQHLHVHLVPRHEGDGLTLPWTGQQKTEPAQEFGPKQKQGVELALLALQVACEHDGHHPGHEWLTTARTILHNLNRGA